MLLLQVEQFVICDSDIEVSRKMQDEMIAAAEEFYQSLGIAYRVVNIVSGTYGHSERERQGDRGGDRGSSSRVWCPSAVAVVNQAS